MQLPAVGDLNLRAKQFLNCQGEWLTEIATIGQNALNSLQISGAAPECLQCPLAVGDVGSRYGNGVRQTLGINGDMPLDARNLFAGIVAFLAGAIGVLDALRVDDQKARRGFAPLSCTGRANHIFLKPAPERRNRLNQARSTWRSRHAPCAISETHSTASVTGSRF